MAGLFVTQLFMAEFGGDIFAALKRCATQNRYDTKS
jgi:hypothetical protein